MRNMKEFDKERTQLEVIQNANLTDDAFLKVRNDT